MEGGPAKNLIDTNELVYNVDTRVSIAHDTNYIHSIAVNVSLSVQFASNLMILIRYMFFDRYYHWGNGSQESIPRNGEHYHY